MHSCFYKLFNLPPFATIEGPVTSLLRRPLGLVSTVRELDSNYGRLTFLDFHLVEKIVTFYSLGHGHDLV